MSPLLTSMLFVPGGDPVKISKLSRLDAPAFILDLEDAVASQVKPEARALVSSVLREHVIHASLWVRVNSQPPDVLHDDLKAIVCRGLGGIVLPKVSNERDIAVVENILSDLEKQAEIEEPIQLMPTIEDVAGLASVDSIAAASPRIRCLAFGAGDFSLDVGLDWPPAGNTSPLLVGAKCQLVLASRRAGIQPPHDGSYPLFHDLEGLRRECIEARDLGMFGKHAVHPGQLKIINSVFAPDKRQLERARTLVAAFDASEKSGRANIDFDGMFVDYPVAERARQLIDLADQIGSSGR